MKINLNTTPCYLNFTTQNKTVVKFPSGLNGAAEFAPERSLLKAEMAQIGIAIPLEDREKFSQKTIVLLTDSDFGKAFYEIYYKSYMNQSNYIWKIS